MDQEEYHLKRKEAANAAIDILRRKYPEVTAGILKDFLRTHMDDLYGGADPIEEFENYVSVNYDSLDEEEKVTEDIEVLSDIMQVVGIENVEDALKAIERYEGDNGPVSREEAKELIADLRATDDDEHDRHITNLMVKAFNTKLKGVSEKKGIDHDNLQNIVTDIESYYAKHKERLQGVFKKVGEIQNEEGFKVGGFLAPAIESAFVKDSRHLGGNRFMKGVEIPQVKVAKFDNLRQEEAPVEAEAAPKETVFGINEKK